MVTAADPKAFEFALRQIEDGNLFESFGQDYLAGVLGYAFEPAGGIRDRGIDGLEHTFNRTGFERTIYQFSIEKDSRSKVRRTLQALKDNDVRFDRLYYVTNRRVSDRDTLVDDLFEIFKKPVTIYDAQWLSVHVNDSEGTIRTYVIFVDSYLHKFNKPGDTWVLADLEGDPRLYTFLRQQWEDHAGRLSLDRLLARTLILFALEGTDPDKGILRSRSEILGQIKNLVKFDPRAITTVIDEELGVLSTKPRLINHHRHQDAYCLRYEVRVSIQDRNLRDAALYEQFLADTQMDFKHYCGEVAFSEERGIDLIERVLHRLFSQQGLEFTNFVLQKNGQESFGQQLPDLVSAVVDDANLPGSAREALKSALLVTIRHMVYAGTPAQKELLRRLSLTYLMVFLLQCDPKLATYFEAMAGNLRVYVDTSILIPAMSEQFLDERNRRFSSLLIGSRRAGVQLIVNETIIDELTAHFRSIDAIYQRDFRGREQFYADEPEILYIQSIMIRAFFYARMRGQVATWTDYLDRFVSPGPASSNNELIEWLRHEFGIRYEGDASVGVVLDPLEVKAVEARLTESKMVFQKARNDAEVILTVYKRRELGNEAGNAGIFGYRTWWLSSDTTTRRALVEVLGDRYPDSCYMRPDFLYNYIILAPSKGESEEIFSELFPSLMGVNISFHVPEEISGTVHRFVNEHGDRNPARVKAALRELSDRLKGDRSYRTREKVDHYLDLRRQELETAQPLSGVR